MTTVKPRSVIITEELADNFVKGESYVPPYSQYYVRRELYSSIIELKHSGVTLAMRAKDTLCINYWLSFTETDKKRLNAILERYNLGKIVVRNGDWAFIDNEGRIIPRKEESWYKYSLTLDLVKYDDFVYLDI